MRFSFVPLFGLVLSAGTAEGATARFPCCADPSEVHLSSAASQAAQAADDKALRLAQDAPSAVSSDASRGWLGVHIQGVTQDIADGLGMRVPAGVLVAFLVLGSPAERAGLRRGDVIVKIDGEDVAKTQTFVERIGRTAPGKTLNLLLYRRGTQQSLTVEVGSPPGAAGRAAQDLPGRSDDIGLNALLGISAELLTDEARSGHGTGTHTWGVVITQVQPTQKLLNVRDVVFEVDQVAVTTPDQLVRRVNAVRRTGRRSVLLAVATPQGETRYAAVPFSSTVRGAREESGGDLLKELPQLEQLEKLK